MIRAESVFKRSVKIQEYTEFLMLKTTSTYLNYERVRKEDEKFSTHTSHLHYPNMLQCLEIPQLLIIHHQR